MNTEEGETLQTLPIFFLNPKFRRVIVLVYLCAQRQRIFKKRTLLGNFQALWPLPTLCTRGCCL